MVNLIICLVILVLTQSVGGYLDGQNLPDGTRAAIVTLGLLCMALGAVLAAPAASRGEGE